MSEPLHSIIARVRRAMPRNMDVMAICEAAEKAEKAMECQECLRRRKMGAQRVRKFRNARDS